MKSKVREEDVRRMYFIENQPIKNICKELKAGNQTIQAVIEKIIRDDAHLIKSSIPRINDEKALEQNAAIRRLAKSRDYTNFALETNSQEVIEAYNKMINPNK